MSTVEEIKDYTIQTVGHAVQLSSYLRGTIKAYIKEQDGCTQHAIVMALMETLVLCAGWSQLELADLHKAIDMTYRRQNGELTDKHREEMMNALPADFRAACDSLRDDINANRSTDPDAN